MSGPWITTCLHGIDLRFTPRCYICKPEGRWVDLASPETAEALARALPAVARSLWARSEAGDHQQVWFDEDVLRHFEEYADDTAAAILAAMRETGR